MDEETAFFVLPSKKAYSQTGKEEVISAFLGFALTQQEVLSLLSGKWEGEENRAAYGSLGISWDLEKDGASRVIAGQKDELRFEVKEFFGRTPVPRLVHFYHPASHGRLKVLDLNFNPQVGRDSFRLNFLGDPSFRAVSWAEMERMLRDED